MRRLLKWIGIGFAVAIFTGMLAAQTVTVPPASSSQVVLNWTDPSVCGSAAPCTFQPYRVPGTVTIAAGTTGATALPVTAAEATSANDASVVAGSTYSYAVETQQGGQNSAPSTTVTVTIPTPPPPPVMGTAVAETTIIVKNGTLTATATTKTTLKVSNSVPTTGK